MRASGTIIRYLHAILDKRYWSEALLECLEEETVLDPQVKDKAPETAWGRLQGKLIT